MFGLGFGEMVVLGVVLLVVVGPRELPTLLRTVGGWVTKLRHMSRELRDQSGIDDIIQEEGLKNDLQAIRSLSRGNVVDTFVRDAMKPGRPRLPAPGAGEVADEIAGLQEPEGQPPPRNQEYPRGGCDDYDATSDDDEPMLPHEPEETAAAPAEPEETAAAPAEPEETAAAPAKPTEEATS